MIMMDKALIDSMTKQAQESMEKFKKDLEVSITNKILSVETFESELGFKSKAIIYKDFLKNGVAVKYSLYNPYHSSKRAVDIVDAVIPQEDLLMNSIQGLLGGIIRKQIAKYLEEKFVRVVEDAELKTILNKEK